MAAYKVTYFDARGNGEIIRLTLKAAGQTFEDERIQRENWAELKPSKYRFDNNVANTCNSFLFVYDMLRLNSISTVSAVLFSANKNRVLVSATSLLFESNLTLSLQELKRA